jgi:O-acetyl-ADP-ribose deacetylase (regulator of RNase III)
MEFNTIEGDLIELAKNRQFDVISHGCNCFSSMSGGIAPLMANAFGCDKFFLERKRFLGMKEKLGKIDWEYNTKYRLFVVNSYTQFKPGPDFRLSALKSCLKNMNRIFAGKHIGLPKIGAGIGGGDWGAIEAAIKNNLRSCDVTIVTFNSTPNKDTQIIQPLKK